MMNEMRIAVFAASPCRSATVWPIAYSAELYRGPYIGIPYECPGVNFTGSQEHYLHGNSL